MKLDKVIKKIPGYDPYRDAKGFHFDVEAAQDAIDFFPEFLVHVKGKKAGQSFELEKWEQAIIANLFGWKRKDGTRRYKYAFIFLPRKNGKTTILAGITNLVHFTDYEAGAEIYDVANDREQARICFEIAKRMIEMDDTLSEKAEIYKNAITIPYLGTSHKPVSSEVKTKWGFNTHLAVIDELHAFDDPSLVEAIETSTAARTQPLVIYITTSDYERESICNEKYDYACKVRDGLIKDSEFLPVIYEALPDDNFVSEKVWKKANPNLNISVGIDYMRAECKKAQDNPRAENAFKRFHLNMKTEQENRWISMAAWNACGTTLDPVVWRNTWLKKMEGSKCVGGLDLGSVSDLTALTLLFEQSDKNFILPWFWLPDEGDWRKSSMIRAYSGWINQGFIALTPGNTADYEFIRQDINGLADKYGIEELPVDRAFQGAHLCTLLQDDGMTIIAVPQTYNNMSAPSFEFEGRVKSGKFQHGSNPVLQWMASNVCAQEDATGKLMRPVKPKNNRHAKIDGIVATVMAVSRLIETQDSGSGYESEEWDRYLYPEKYKDETDGQVAAN